jgi:hypothetical protein
MEGALPHGIVDENKARMVLTVFTISLFTSAMLLFGVQPMFAKMVLPKLGGSAAVWSIALVFFQAVLLLGYGYAHVLSSRLTVRTAGVVHMCVLGAACFFLPLAYPQGWEIPPADGLASWTIALFAAGVGVPFFAVSANAPLLQSWFSRTGHRHSADPYFLYGASNVGSFAALLLYPFAIEPLTTLQLQSWMWTAGYAALAGSIVLCAMLTVSAQRNGTSHQSLPARQQAAALAPLTWNQRAPWIWLAFVPSALLVSVTSYISTDLVAAPLLWTIPLALFLLTFVIAFQRKPVISLEQVSWWHKAWLVPVMVILLWHASVLFMVPLHLTAFFIMALLCHSELVARRPAAANLTEFYLWMSFGGVLGGFFTSIVSPLIFNQVLEYPVLVVAACFCRSDVWSAIRQRRLLGLWTFAAVPLVLLPAALNIDFGDRMILFMLVVYIALGFSLLKVRPAPLAQAGLLAAAFVATLTYGYQTNAIERVRSFYGVHSVSERGGYHLLSHGTTLHGVQQWPPVEGRRPLPLSYYYDDGPFDDILATQRKLKGKLSDVAVIGLGSGALSCQKQPGENWQYFEIDPEVVKIARDERFFSFLRDCDPQGAITVGDGRLTLAEVGKNSLDVLIVDAFSSDSIPAHLLTTQALEMYLSRLKQDGVVVFHVSNRYMALPGVVAAIAAARNALAYANWPGGDDWPIDMKEHRSPAQLVVVARNEKHLGETVSNGKWRPLVANPSVSPWTDDYSNILGAIWRKFAR